VDSVEDSVWAAVGAYMGSFFKLPKWQKVYPSQTPGDRWEMGLVASFAGATWRLHGGPNGQVLYTISQERLRSSNSEGDAPCARHLVASSTR